MRYPMVRSPLLSKKGRVQEVTRLYGRDDVPEEDCWLRGMGWCLAYR